MVHFQVPLPGLARDISTLKAIFEMSADLARSSIGQGTLAIKIIRDQNILSLNV